MTEIKINRDAIKKIGHLARLRIEEHEAEKYSENITAVINWFNMLDEVDVSEVNETCSDATPLREDAIKDGGMAEKVVSNAKDSKFNMFSVPKVVE